MRYIDQMKKIFVLMVAALSVTIVSVTNSGAAMVVTLDGTAQNYLYLIAQYTNGTMVAVQNLPTYFHGYLEMANGLMAQDDGKDGNPSIIMNTQSDFATLGVGTVMSDKTQNSSALQTQIFADLLGVKVSDFQGKDPKIKQSFPDISVNDLAYGSMIGAKPLQNDGNNPYNYVKNAALFNMPHAIPDSSWQGRQEDIEKYQNYFYSIAAIQSFNSYVLSQMASDATNNAGAIAHQEALVTQATNSGWIAQIATEEIGKVLRQILLFESQNFVMNMQIMKYTRTLAMNQAMTNSLLILFNQLQENQMVRNAKGLPAGA